MVFLQGGKPVSGFCAAARTGEFLAAVVISHWLIIGCAKQPAVASRHRSVSFRQSQRPVDRRQTQRTICSNLAQFPAAQNKQRKQQLTLKLLRLTRFHQDNSQKPSLSRTARGEF